MTVITFASTRHRLGLPRYMRRATTLLAALYVTSTFQCLESGRTLVTPRTTFFRSHASRSVALAVRS